MDSPDKLLFVDALELADTVAEVLPASVPEVHDRAADAIDVVIERLDSSPLVEALKLANEKLPLMLKKIVDRFFDPNESLTVNQQVRIFEMVQDFALTDDRSRQVMGMMKDQIKAGASMVFQQLNLNTKELRTLPHGSVDDHLRMMAQEKEGHNGQDEGSAGRREESREDGSHPSVGEGTGIPEEEEGT